ncbi:MAG: hypothetical protein K2K67_08345 [Treponemataceae bacterium]|nr:hypothetical protein [Treponemataceae bacterium]
MKRLLSLCLLLSAVLLLCVGCQSAPVVLEEHSPVIVLAVTGNQSLPWKEQENQGDDDSDEAEGEGVLTNLVNKVLKGNDVEYLAGYDRLDYAMGSFHALLAENAGVEVVDETDLFAAKSYATMRENILNFMEAKISATKYKLMLSIGSKRARMIMEETGAKSMILADFVFQKTNIRGNRWTGEVAALVTMKIIYLDERGKEIVNKTYTATSLERLPITRRKYDKDVLVDLYPATIDAVINQFIVDNL